MSSVWKGKGERGNPGQESHRTFPRHSTETQQHYLSHSLFPSTNIFQKHLPYAGNSGTEKNVTMAGLKILRSDWGAGRMSQLFPVRRPPTPTSISCQSLTSFPLPPAFSTPCPALFSLCYKDPTGHLQNRIATIVTRMMALLGTKASHKW